MSQKAGSTIRIDDDIEQAVREKLFRDNQKLNPLLNRWLREWVTGKRQSPQLTTPHKDLLISLARISQRLDVVARDAAALIETQRIDRHASIADLLAEADDALRLDDIENEDSEDSGADRQTQSG